MGNWLIIELSLANVPPGEKPLRAEDVYEFLESNVEGIETYQFYPRGITAAAIDYTILYVAGSISSLAAFIWLAYDKFIASRKTRPTDRGGICVAIRESDGGVKNFFIGEKYLDRDVFVGEFEATVTDSLGDHKSAAKTARRIRELRQSGVWIRRK